MKRKIAINAAIAAAITAAIAMLFFAGFKTKEIVNFCLTAAVIAGIGFAMHKAVKNWKAPVTDLHNLTLFQENSTGVIAWALAGASMLFSLKFAYELAQGVLMTAGYIIMFGGLCAGEFLSSFHLANNWKRRRLGAVFATAFMLMAGFTVSIIAGQSYLAGVVDRIEQERMLQSSEYSAAMSNRQRASDRASSLATSEGAFNFATAEIERLGREHRAFLDSQARNTNGKNAGTVSSVISRFGCSGHYSGYCDMDKDYKAQIAAHKDTVRKYHEYQGALDYADKLNSTPIKSAVTDATLPGIKYMSIFMEMDPEQLKSNVFLYISLFVELFAIICFYLHGKSRMDRGEHPVAEPARENPRTRQAPAHAVTHGYGTASPSPAMAFSPGQAAYAPPQKPKINIEASMNFGGGNVFVPDIKNAARIYDSPCVLINDFRTAQGTETREQETTVPVPEKRIEEPSPKPAGEQYNATKIGFVRDGERSFKGTGNAARNKRRASPSGRSVEELAEKFKATGKPPTFSNVKKTCNVAEPTARKIRKILGVA